MVCLTARTPSTSFLYFSLLISLPLLNRYYGWTLQLRSFGGDCKGNVRSVLFTDRNNCRDFPFFSSVTGLCHTYTVCRDPVPSPLGGGISFRGDDDCVSFRTLSLL